MVTQTLLGICASYTVLPLSTYILAQLVPALPLIGSPKNWHVGRLSLAPGGIVFWAFSLILPSFISYVLIFKLHSEASQDFEAHVWDAERRRGVTSVSIPENHENPAEDEDEHGILNESAEWTNSLLTGLWPRIDPDLFTSVVDMLEDVMQASMPRVVHSIRVSDLGQGRIAPRITGIRPLPPRRNEDGEEQGEHVVSDFIFIFILIHAGFIEELVVEFRVVVCLPCTSQRCLCQQ